MIMLLSFKVNAHDKEKFGFGPYRPLLLASQEVEFLVSFTKLLAWSIEIKSNSMAIICCYSGALK